MSKSLTQQKYEAIRKDYRRWDDKRYKGVRIYTDAYIYKRLSEKFFLSPSTIEHILFSRIKQEG